MRKNQHIFYPDHFYHVFNRTNNKEKLFTKIDNYHYFLKKYDKYLSPVLKTYCYCLLGNHFHLLVKVNTEKELLCFQKEKESDWHSIISKQFTSFFGTYSKAFNKQENRNGSLFQRPFKRVLITNEVKFGDVIYYIHANPALHKISANFKTYKWSSYQAILSDKQTKVEREEILEWFGGLDCFIKYHDESHAIRESTWMID